MNDQPEGKRSMTIFKKALLLSVVAVLMVVGSANATPYYFTRITNNGGAAIPWNQLWVDVTANLSLVDFTFYNDVGVASSITDIYFDDGTLLGISTIRSSAGVEFSQLAKPGNLPSANSASAPFEASEGFRRTQIPRSSQTGSTLHRNGLRSHSNS